VPTLPTAKRFRRIRNGARLLVCLHAMVSLAAAADTNEPARMKITGFGWLGTRE
jgi:hypothetical protein